MNDGMVDDMNGGGNGAAGAGRGGNGGGRGSAGTFTYAYSAARQEEIDRIREKYLPKSESKMDQLRRLDGGTTRKGTVASITMGVVGCLLLGVGMACTMVWDGGWFIPGVIVGVLGIALVAAAYPVYRRVTERERARVAPLILQLADELSDENR